MDNSSMATYSEIPIDQIILDTENPRIARILEYKAAEMLTEDDLALALGSSEDKYESLKESIKSNKGIIHPIVVKKLDSEKYLAIEGNTRVQIYRKFIKTGVPGEWTKIRAIIYDNISDSEIHAIRLQAHLVGPRDWDPYSKAKYLHLLSNKLCLPMSMIISFCGGNATEVRNMINAYIDMEQYYRSQLDDDTWFDQKKFSAFVELQRKRVVDAIIFRGFSKTDFSNWIINGNIDKLQDVRCLPDILNSPQAQKIFLSSNSTAALKVIAAEEIITNKLKDIPYESLADELCKKIKDLSYKEVRYLKTDVTYQEKANILKKLYEELSSVLNY